jgi:large subunit ribosomal protein L35
MPKMKTRKAAAKRFSFTASGKVKTTQANKIHRMRNRSKGTLRRQRGEGILDVAETKRVKKFLPNG